MDKNEPYYYPVTGWNGQDCTQRCMVKDNGVMIGSASCQDCEFMLDMGVPYNESCGPDWIICSRIEAATKNIEE